MAQASWTWRASSSGEEAIEGGEVKASYSESEWKALEEQDNVIGELEAQYRLPPAETAPDSQGQWGAEATREADEFDASDALAEQPTVGEYVSSADQLAWARAHLFTGRVSPGQQALFNSVDGETASQASGGLAEIGGTTAEASVDGAAAADAIGTVTLGSLAAVVAAGIVPGLALSDGIDQVFGVPSLSEWFEQNNQEVVGASAGQCHTEHIGSGGIGGEFNGTSYHFGEGEYVRGPEPTRIHFDHVTELDIGGNVYHTEFYPLGGEWFNQGCVLEGSKQHIINGQESVGGIGGERENGHRELMIQEIPPTCAVSKCGKAMGPTVPEELALEKETPNDDEATGEAHALPGRNPAPAFVPVELGNRAQPLASEGDVKAGVESGATSELAPHGVPLTVTAPEQAAAEALTIPAFQPREDVETYVAELHAAGFTNVTPHELPEAEAAPSLGPNAVVSVSPAPGTTAPPGSPIIPTYNPPTIPGGYPSGNGIPPIRFPQIHDPCNVFPFGVPCFLVSGLKNIVEEQEAPHFTVYLWHETGGQMNVNFAIAEPFMEVLRPIFVFVAVLGVAVMFYNLARGKHIDEANT